MTIYYLLRPPEAPQPRGQARDAPVRRDQRVGVGGTHALRDEVGQRAHRLSR